MKIPDLELLLHGRRVTRPPHASDADLRQLGLLFDGKRVWLADDARPIDVVRLRAGLSSQAAATWSDLEVVSECESTNASLLARVSAHSWVGIPGRGCVLTTEYQWGGRGRRGRGWLSPVARNIALSVAWEYPGPLADLSGLSLAVGVACADALHTLGLREVALKWPNDLIVDSASGSDGAYAKLGGILVELLAAPGGSIAVIGVGLNFSGAALLRSQVPQPLADIAEMHDDLDRTTVLIGLLNALADYLGQFATSGFAPLVPAWNELHAFAGKRVIVGDPENLERGQTGVVLGISAAGELRLATADGERLVGAGEVSLRPGFQAGLPS